MEFSKTSVLRADTIKFDKILVGANSAEFQHGIDLANFRSWQTWSNFGWDRLGRICQIFDQARLGKSWPHEIEFRLWTTWLNTAKSRPMPTRKNFGWNRLDWIRLNFGQSRLGRIWPKLSQGPLYQITVRVDLLEFVGRDRVDW